VCKSKHKNAYATGDSVTGFLHVIHGNFQENKGILLAVYFAVGIRVIKFD